jgi:hypothetical protein
MTDEDIAEFGHLWSDQAKDQFLLVALSGDRMSPEQCLIYTKATKTVKRISDDQLAAEVKRRMAGVGVPITLSLPWA